MADITAIDTTTDQYYYENPSEWGKDQFITLENVIDNILLTADDDSYFKHSKRFRASIFGKQGMKRLEIDLKPQNKAIEIQLSPSKTFPYPRYMTNWNRISVLNKCGKLTVLDVNNHPQIQDYIQDHEWNLIYDDTGEIIEGNPFDAEVEDCCKLEIQCKSEDSTCEDENDDCFENSWVRDNKKGSFFEFSEDLVDELIIFEFETAGLESIKDCDIKIPHALELTIENWIRCQLLKGKRNVPANEWRTYWEFYKIEKRRSKSILGQKITPQQILKSISLRYK